MKVAVGLPQIGQDVDAVLHAAQHAEEAGAWGVWVFDNLAPLLRPDKPALDGWALAGPIGLSTSRVHVVSLVTRAGLRAPALVARMSAVTAAACGGRFVLGLGIGDPPAYEEERRFGIEASTARADRMAELEETISRVRADPLPVRPEVAPPPIWIGGRARDLVELAARDADAWHGWGLDPDGFARRARRVRELAGRPIECWWGDIFRHQTAEPTARAVRDAGADGITWMVVSDREASDRPALLELAARLAPL